AFAATDPDPGTVYTGCLGTSGSASGKLAALAPGTHAQRACTDSEQQVSLGNGDITSVRTTTDSGIVLNGTGLLGSILDSSGQVEVSLNKNYRLPQNCTAEQLVKRTANGWTCVNPPKVKHAYAGQNRSSGKVGNDWAVIGGPLTVPPGAWTITAKS